MSEKNVIEIPKTVIQKMEALKIGEAKEITGESELTWRANQTLFHRMHTDRRLKIWNDKKRMFIGRIN